MRRRELRMPVVVRIRKAGGNVVTRFGVVILPFLLPHPFSLPLRSVTIISFLCSHIYPFSPRDRPPSSSSPFSFSSRSSRCSSPILLPSLAFLLLLLLLLSIVLMSHMLLLRTPVVMVVCGMLARYRFVRAVALLVIGLSAARGATFLRETLVLASWARVVVRERG